MAVLIPVNSKRQSRLVVFLITRLAPVAPCDARIDEINTRWRQSRAVAISEAKLQKNLVTRSENLTNEHQFPAILTIPR